MDKAKPHGDRQQRFRFLKRLHAVGGRGAGPLPSLLHDQGCHQGPTIRKRRNEAEGQIGACNACAQGSEPLSVCPAQDCMRSSHVQTESVCSGLPCLAGRERPPALRCRSLCRTPRRPTGSRPSSAPLTLLASRDHPCVTLSMFTSSPGLPAGEGPGPTSRLTSAAKAPEYT